jgi:hypothetical protein
MKPEFVVLFLIGCNPLLPPVFVRPSPVAAWMQESSAPRLAIADTVDLQLPAGTVIEAALAKPLDTKRAKKGDLIITRTTVDVRHGGIVLLQQSTKLIGHVINAIAATKDQHEAEIEFTVDSAELKHDKRIFMSTILQAISMANGSTRIMSPAVSPAMDGGGSLITGRPPLERHGGRSIKGGWGEIGAQASGRDGHNAVGTAVPSMPRGDSGSRENRSHSTVGLAGINVQGELAATVHGVIGIKGVTLRNANGSSALLSPNGNFRLESGTLMLLVVE